MNQKRKRWLILLTGWGFILLGIAGLFLPILQGILFLVIGLHSRLALATDVQAGAGPDELESGSPPVAPVPLGTIFRSLSAERVRIPTPWNQSPPACCFAVVPLAARAVVGGESSSFWASFGFCRRPPGQYRRDFEECAKPPVWTRSAFQMLSTHLLSVASDRLRAGCSGRVRSRRRFVERCVPAPHSAQIGPALRPRG